LDQYYLGSGEAEKEVPEGLDAEMALSILRCPARDRGLYGFNMQAKTRWLSAAQ
jgi:hypothetical protein